MRLLKSTLPALILCTMASTAYAESGWYLGASLGNSEVGFQDTDTSSIDVDDSDTGFKITTGLKFTILAAEASYIDFGKIEGANSSIEVSGFDAFAVMSMGLGPVEAFGKLGGFVWDAEGEYSVDDAVSSFEDDGFSPAIGLGVGFNLGDMGVKAEYEYFDIDEFDKISMLSVGVNFWLL